MRAIAVLSLAAGLAGAAVAARVLEPALAGANASGGAQHALGRMSIPFAEAGDSRATGVRYKARLFGSGALLVTGAGELIYELPAGRVSERFIGGTATPHSGTPHATRVSSFIGNDPALHRADAPTFEHVALGEVFAGIDVKLRATGKNVEKIFTVRPGADPRLIRIELAGARDVRVGTDGALHGATENGEVAFTPPLAYQTIAGRWTPVEVAYALDATRNVYGFAVGDYDRSAPLVIDPLLKATYLGGGALDNLFAITVNPLNGEIIAAGNTFSTNLPCTSAGGLCGSGAFPQHASDGGAADAFIARLSPDLTELRQVTYFGGNGSDAIGTLVVHPATGEIIAAGGTSSTDLPCTTIGGGCGNGAQTSKAGAADTGDGFIIRLSSNLTQLKQTTYFGGTGNEFIASLALHPLTGELIAAGNTVSTDLPCAVAGNGCANGAQTAKSNDGGQDEGFVARLSADLTQLKQTTYFGGNHLDDISTMAVHPINGDIVIAGTTRSSDLACTNATVTCAQALQSASASAPNFRDAFVARLSADLTQLKQTTYLGGNFSDYITAMQFDLARRELVVAGITGSTNLPCTVAGNGCANGAQPQHASDMTLDGYVARLSDDLTRLRQLTYVGGTGSDGIAALVLLPGNGEVVVAGGTSAPDLPCTTSASGCSNAIQAARAADGGSRDGFIARLSADLMRFLQVTYLGGNGFDTIDKLVLHPQSGDLIVAGQTTSTDWPCIGPGTCASGAQPSPPGGDNDGYILRVSTDLTLTDTTPSPIAFAPVNNAPVSRLVTSGPVQVTGIGGTLPVYVEGALGSAYCLSSTSGCLCDASGGGFVSTPGVVGANQYVCVRHVSSAADNEITATIFHAGGGGGVFRVATGALFGTCTLDVDGDNAIDAMTDGLVLMRAMLGLTGSSVTNAAIGAGATRKTWAQIRDYMNGNCGANFAQ